MAQQSTRLLYSGFIPGKNPFEQNAPELFRVHISFNDIIWTVVIEEIQRNLNEDEQNRQIDKMNR